MRGILLYLRPTILLQRNTFLIQLVINQNQNYSKKDKKMFDIPWTLGVIIFMFILMKTLETIKFYDVKKIILKI